MSQNPHTYGTGRDPARKDSHLVQIVLLLLCCVAIHGLTFLYLRSKDTTNSSETPNLELEEFSDNLAEEDPALQDCCGLGLQFSELSDTEQNYWSLPDGVFVEQIDTDSPAYSAGLRPGDLLVRVGTYPVNDPGECSSAFRQYCGKPSLELTYYREGAEYTICVYPQP